MDASRINPTAKINFAMRLCFKLVRNSCIRWAAPPLLVQPETVADAAVFASIFQQLEDTLILAAGQPVRLRLDLERCLQPGRWPAGSS
jgi:hypothetical protein